MYCYCCCLPVVPEAAWGPCVTSSGWTATRTRAKLARRLLRVRDVRQDLPHRGRRVHHGAVRPAPALLPGAGTRLHRAPTRAKERDATSNMCVRRWAGLLI
ncbi:Protein of unknown function [Gryllus bimaculatus]|nr:Protein of unknown function [Gryllus bimaculatus]